MATIIAFTAVAGEKETIAKGLKEDFAGNALSYGYDVGAGISNDSQKNGTV